MRTDLGHTLRRLFPPRRKPGRRQHGSDGPLEVASEFTTEELEEFVQADTLPVQADPAFKERLREELWEVVQNVYSPPARDRSGGE
ncbi:MAG: hypothetical protein ABFS46_04675 [Myxococcota bacterium]